MKSFFERCGDSRASRIGLLFGIAAILSIGVPYFFHPVEITESVTLMECRDPSQHLTWKPNRFLLRARFLVQ